MKAIIRVEKEVEIKTLIVKAKIRYYEDADVNGIEDVGGTLIPCKIGEVWCPVIDIDSGIIINWEKGKTAKIHYKVCDCGIYSLYDDNNNLVKEIDGYVPSIMCPKENGYGDYIIMDVDENGKIDKWTPLINDFFDED